jgi:hypothetical protein
MGIPAPMSGNPKYNQHANDIDFQIEADFIGIMCPGMPQRVIELCDRVGHVMNYGDGVYGGMYVCGMYATAFFEKDVATIVDAGIACLPEGSQYRKVIEDVVATHAAHPDDWTECWRIITSKYDKYESCPDGSLAPFNIDASMNGAYVTIGLLYGGGDFGKSIEIAARCGHDSDCNPASAGGVLGLVYGYKAMDPYWIGGIAKIQDENFNYTQYSFNSMVASTMKRALAAVVAGGGKIDGDEIEIPVTKPVPPKLEQWSMGIPHQQIRAEDPECHWTGSWSERKWENRPSMASVKKGDEVSMNFTGSAVAVMGVDTPKGGYADVYLDGKKVDRLNAYTDPRTHDTALWHRYGLENTKHTLRIVVAGEADPRSEGTEIWIERVVAFTPER